MVGISLDPWILDQSESLVHAVIVEHGGARLCRAGPLCGERNPEGL
jgi:hypothetical protein